MKNARIPVMDFDMPAVDTSYSNHKSYSLGHGQNGKGYVDREHEQSKSWSDKQILDTGLTDKEPL